MNNWSYSAHSLLYTHTVCAIYCGKLLYIIEWKLDLTLNHVHMLWMLYFVGNVAFFRKYDSTSLYFFLNYYPCSLCSLSRQRKSLEGQALLDGIRRDGVLSWIAMTSLTDKVWY